MPQKLFKTQVSEGPLLTGHRFLPVFELVTYDTTTIDLLKHLYQLLCLLPTIDDQVDVTVLHAVEAVKERAENAEVSV